MVQKDAVLQTVNALTKQQIYGVTAQEVGEHLGVSTRDALEALDALAGAGQLVFVEQHWIQRDDQTGEWTGEALVRRFYRLPAQR